MRQVLSGAGIDTTSAVAAWLRANNQLQLADLYLIGAPDDPRAIWLTDYESPLSWPIWGTFNNAVIRRSPVPTKIGLEVPTLDIEWSPTLTPFTANIDTANPYQKAQAGFYDNWDIRLWTAYMPTAGDANTYGCSALFGGRIGNSSVERGLIKFSCMGRLDVINQEVPTNVIELTNTRAAYAGATPPPGAAAVPQFNVITGSTQTKIYARATSPTLDQIFADNVLRGGYMVFNRGGSQTLGDIWSAVYANTVINIAGTDYNEIVLYSPLPWAPTPGTDTCYVSGSFPLNAADAGAEYFGFPYVPSPNSAV